MIRFMHEFPRIHTLAGVARTAYNQHDSIVKPIVAWLRAHGVKILLGARVVDINFSQVRDGTYVADKIVYMRDGKKRSVAIAPADIVLFTNGCMTDNSNEAGTDTVARYIKDDTAPSFELWRKIADGRPEFGDPDVFCGRVDESMWMSFTTTINKNPRLLDYIQRFSHNYPGGGALMTFKDSAWRLSIVVARQPHFKNQPMDTQIFWGYSLNMFVDGDYVKKPERMRAAYTRILKDYPNMIAALDNRYIVYNESLALCDRLQKEGRAVVIAPEYALPIDKFGTDKEKLEHCYYEGMRDCKHSLESIEALLSDKA